MEPIFWLFRIIFFPILILMTLLRAWSTNWQALRDREHKLDTDYEELFGANHEIIRAIGLDPPEGSLALAAATRLAELQPVAHLPSVPDPVVDLAVELLKWEEGVLASKPNPLQPFVKLLRDYRRLQREAGEYRYGRKLAFLTNLDARHRRIRAARFSMIAAIETFKAQE